MEDYEASAKDFLATAGTLAPSRSLQANIVYQGRVRYLALVKELGDKFAAVRRNLGSSIAQRSLGMH